MPHLELEPVYILNRRPYKESSLLLEIFSYRYGRLSILAKGALNSKKGWAAFLQVFQPLLMTWSGRSALKTLVSVEAPSGALNLQQTRLFSAYYLNELLLKLLPGTAGQASVLAHSPDVIFVNYANALDNLQHAQSIELVLREFEYILLNELGIFPDCQHDIAGSAIVLTSNYIYALQQGFKLLMPDRAVPKSPGLVLSGQLIQMLNSGLTDALNALPLNEQTALLKQLKPFMRALIADALGGQVLKSRSLFQSYPFTRSSS